MTMTQETPMLLAQGPHSEDHSYGLSCPLWLWLPNMNGPL